MKELIDILKSKNLLDTKGVKIKSIMSLDLVNFVDLNSEIERLIENNKPKANRSIFSHTASLGLGGSTIECSSLDCRLKRINKLARFGLMYSDNVTISSFFTGYDELTDEDDLEWHLYRFYDDLRVLFEIKDPLESGLISFTAPITNVCFTCQAEEFLGKKAAAKFPLSYKQLQNSYLKNMEVICEKIEDGYEFDCDGPIPFFDHIGSYTMPNLPDAINKRIRIKKRIENEKIVKLSKTLIKEIGLHEDYAHTVVTNAIHGLSTSKRFNTSFLTENDLHLSLLNSLQAEYEVSRRNQIASKHLTSIVPYAEDVDVKNLVILREREKEAFLVYRQSINQAITEFTKLNGTFTENDAKQLYSDVIEPTLASLDIRVKKAKKDLICKPLRSLTGAVGSISFGLLTGIVSPKLTAIVSAIGLAKFGTDLIKDTMATGDKEDAIKEEQFYFLWKVRNAR